LAIEVPRWQKGTLRSIELHPVPIGFGKLRMERGTPRIAD